jgi:hypothetical protein
LTKVVLFPEIEMSQHRRFAHLTLCLLAAPAWACFPMPNPAGSGLPNPAKYTDLGNGTVRDGRIGSWTSNRLGLAPAKTSPGFTT